MTEAILALLKQYFSWEKDIIIFSNPEDMKNILKENPKSRCFLIFRNKNNLRRNLCLGTETDTNIYCLTGADLWTFFPSLEEFNINHNEVSFCIIYTMGKTLAKAIKRNLALINFHGAAIQPPDNPEVHFFDPN